MHSGSYFRLIQRVHTTYGVMEECQWQYCIPLREISCEETAHYMHFCNWTNQVTHLISLTFIIAFKSTTLVCWYSNTLIDELNGFYDNSPHHFRDVCTTIIVRKYVNRCFNTFSNTRMPIGCFISGI